MHVYIVHNIFFSRDKTTIKILKLIKIFTILHYFDKNIASGS